jgi:hypothetical protein
MTSPQKFRPLLKNFSSNYWKQPIIAIIMSNGQRVEFIKGDAKWIRNKSLLVKC